MGKKRSGWNENILKEKQKTGRIKAAPVPPPTDLFGQPVQKQKVKRINWEDDLQERCINAFRMDYPDLRFKLFHIPNGGSRHPAEAAKLKDMGTMPGVADLFLMVAARGYHGLWIEMKYGKNTQEPDQRTFQANAESEGYCYRVAWTLDEFLSHIRWYLHETKYQPRIINWPLVRPIT